MREIILTQGKVALVDDEDFDKVNQFKWYAQKSRNGKVFYAVRRNGGRRLLLHRFLMLNVNQIDHIDGNGLNNQKTNLRPATGTQNQGNKRKPVARCSSNYKGVYWDTSRQSWRVQIQFQYRNLQLGRYESEVDAAHVYDYAAKTYFGEFARLNFP